MAKRPDNTTVVWQFLRGKGLSPAQAAGVIGGLSGESGKGLSTTAVNPSSGAYGIAQWLGGRKSALMSQKNPSSLKTQLNFLWSELQGPESGALGKIKQAHSIPDAVNAWVLGFERPAANETTLGPRTQTARQVFDSLKGVSGGSSLANAAPGAVAASAQTAQGDAGATALLGQILGQQRQAPAATPLQAPSFSAGPQLPSGYQGVQSSGAPAPPPDVSGALQAVSQLQGQEPPATVPAPSADVTGAATGPAAGGSFGKSHSPLFELIHNGDRPYAVKNGKVVDKSVYNDVWAGHANHVHVAAGPNTIVALGKLAQSMGLTVGENVYFTGKQPGAGVHAGQSYHYRSGKTKSGKLADEAIDVSGDPAKMNVYAQRVQALYGLG